jgi:hypothetical protein
MLERRQAIFKASTIEESELPKIGFGRFALLRSVFHDNAWLSEHMPSKCPPFE